MLFAHLGMLFCGRGEMVDAADLKSAIHMGVPVRVRPSAPACTLIYLIIIIAKPCS